MASGSEIGIRSSESFGEPLGSADAGSGNEHGGIAVDPLLLPFEQLIEISRELRIVHGYFAAFGLP